MACTSAADDEDQEERPPALPRDGVVRTAGDGVARCAGAREWHNAEGAEPARRARERGSAAAMGSDQALGGERRQRRAMRELSGAHPARRDCAEATDRVLELHWLPRGHRGDHFFVNCAD